MKDPETDQQIELEDDNDCIEEIPTLHSIVKHAPATRRNRIVNAALRMEQAAQDWGTRNEEYEEER